MTAAASLPAPAVYEHLDHHWSATCAMCADTLGWWRQARGNIDPPYARPEPLIRVMETRNGEPLHGSAEQRRSWRERARRARRHEQEKERRRLVVALTESAIEEYWEIHPELTWAGAERELRRALKEKVVAK